MSRSSRRAGPASGRAFGYCRVSGAEQGRHGTSLEAQQDEITRYCRAHGLGKPALFIEVESGASEKLERRRELGRLVGDARAGDTIIVTRVDRWSRDLVHAVASIRELVGRGVRWLSIGDNIDASTSSGDSMLGIMAWAADAERKRIKERTVDRRKALRDEGKFVEGLPPVGYRRGAGRVLEIVEPDAAIVRELFRRCIAGDSLSQLQARLRAEHPGRHGWDRQVLHRMLRSRHYLGEVQTSRGEWIASHEPLVTRVTFQRAQDALAARRLGGRSATAEARTAGWLLRGLGVCGLCGSRMGAAYSRTRRGEPTNYYACCGRLARRGCRAGYVRVEPCDAAVADLVPAQLADLRDVLTGSRPVEPDRQDFGARRRRLEERRERLVDLAADGAITREQLRQRLDRVAADLGRIDAEEHAAERARAATAPAARRELLRQVRQIGRAWVAADVAERRAILGAIAHDVTIAAGSAPVPRWRTPAELVQEL